jgi:glycosyltransferase involved in cell wall biosynthesis
MSQPLITVIIPFYSQTHGLLLKAANSALSQSILVEVVVVDDASPVSAASELSSVLGDPRVKIIRHKVNRHGGIARNTGIDNASGEFVAFLDYDDLWYPDKLEKQLKLFNEKTNNLSDSDKLVIYSRCKIIDGKREFIRPIRAILKDESVGEYLFCAKQIIQTSGIFLKTITAKSVRFDDLKRHQDYQFCLSLEAQGCMFFMLDEPSYEFIQIPKLNDYIFSMKWLNFYESCLNNKAVQGFKSLVLIRSMVSHGHYKKAFIYSLQNKLFLSYFKVCSIKLIKKTIIYISLIKR